jgi:hypothetical protein
MRPAQAILTLDHGSATTAVALLGRLDDHWRLLAALSAPAGTPVHALVSRLVGGARAADPQLLEQLGLGEAGAGAATRLEVRSSPARRIAVAAATERAIRPFVDAVRRSGWQLVTTTADRDDPLVMANRLLDPDVELILVASGEPPGADERGALAELRSLVRGVATRRPELRIALAGAVAREPAGKGDPLGRPGVITVPVDESLPTILRSLRVLPDDARTALIRATGSIAEALDRRIEVVEIGMRGALHAIAEPGEPGEPAIVRSSIVAQGGLFGEDADAIVDGVAGWSALSIDRLRLADRLAELREAPWADAAGDGARLRLAAARAAVVRLLAADRSLEAADPPDVTILSGGAWTTAPPPAVALAVADVLRRPGATQLVLDHAHVLAPLGRIEDDDQRRDMIRDLAGDIVAPLAALVVTSGLRAGRGAGRLRVHGIHGVTDIDLLPGGLELVDLPPGETATVEVDLRDGATVAGRGRHVAVELAGGLAGLLIDLRGVPLKLPDRPDSRRELLAAWEGALWAGLEA